MWIAGQSFSVGFEYRDEGTHIFLGQNFIGSDCIQYKTAGQHIP